MTSIASTPSIPSTSLEMSQARTGGLHTIGEAAKASGVSAKMIRHYEVIGLIPPGARTQAGYRVFTSRDIQDLRFIYRARELGFSLDDIKELLSLWQDKHRASKEVRALAQTHIAALNERIGELQAMRSALEKLVDACHGDHRPECPIIDKLARP